MKDRTPTYPGRVKLTPVPGQENTYDMERADLPRDEGTPLNKNTLLRDNTVKRLGGNSYMTVNGAINTLIDESKFLIGDVVPTMGDIEDNWLIADGRKVSEEDYPVLYEMLAYSGYEEVRTFAVTSSSSADDDIFFLKKINGYYIGLKYGCLFYRAEKATTWTVRNILSTLLGTRYKLEDADMLWDDVNKRYLLAARVRRSSTNNGLANVKLFYMASLSSTPVEVFEHSSYDTGELALYKAGKYFCLSDLAGDNVQALNNVAETYYATDPKGTWTKITGSNVGMRYSIQCIRYINNRYFVGGIDVDSSASMTYAAVAYTKEGQTLENGTWTVKRIAEDHGVSTDKNPSRYYLVNNILYMPNCGAYLFEVGEQMDNVDYHYYSYDLETIEVSYTRGVGGSSDYQKQIGSILYTPYGAYRDIPGNTGEPLRMLLSSEVTQTRRLTEDGVYCLSDTNSTTVKENRCFKTLPDLGTDNGMLYKVKAKGKPMSGDGEDPGTDAEWNDIEFTDPNGDGHIVITIGGE